ncbi:hypothetical protein [uncultured Thiodictyon sp.]|jgi:hypothetical protein|uniref:hypothetical protein n=1 Tax=uncultured Thiodictyon sp. TaxID=1846217 RepID=UPI0025E5DC29|nr:hypothetical protein [uncultured Thiodictyon sp.]
MQFGVRENPGRYDNLDYDTHNDNDNEHGAIGNPQWTSLCRTKEPSRNNLNNT